MAGVVSGNFEFAFGKLTSVMVAHEEGLPVQYVTNGTSVTGSEDGFGAVVVPEDSDIQSAADLPGNTVSTNNFANITGDTVNYAVARDGRDPPTIDYIELPWPGMPAAAMSGQADAAMVVEPCLTQWPDQGARGGW